MHIHVHIICMFHIHRFLMFTGREMLDDLAKTSQGQLFSLIKFRPIFFAARVPMPGRFKLHYTLDFPPANWNQKKGFITAEMWPWHLIEGGKAADMADTSASCRLLGGLRVRCRCETLRNPWRKFRVFFISHCTWTPNFLGPSRWYQWYPDIIHRLSIDYP